MEEESRMGFFFPEPKPLPEVTKENLQGIKFKG
jgi:hypothetical protein